MSMAEQGARALEAWVDGCVEGVIHGWAYWPAHPAEKPVIEAVAGGVVVGDGLAVLRRDDLARHGHGDGLSGFAIPLDAALWRTWDGGDLAVTVRLRGGAMLAGGELVLDGSALGAGPGMKLAGPAVWPPTPWALRGGGVAGYIDRFGPERVEGWAQYQTDKAARVTIELWEDGAAIGTVTADQWRKDLEETRQGDGRWSMGAAVPEALRDGRVHRLELRLAGQMAPVLDHPVAVQFARPAVAAGLHSTASDEERPSLRSRPLRHDSPDDVLFSIVVNFYNMAREAERTLTALSRAYQRNIGALRYEVLCIDNFSGTPLDADWIASFGPEFRLVRPSRRLASPCFAINEAAAQAAGRYIAIMIDGAHILTPGALREVWDAVTEAPEAVVALRQWFIGGDQRWLASVGYTRAQEDLLFDKIGWPADGYKMFSIGSPVWESPNSWFDGMIESNCLFVPASLYRDIGGMDEAFDEPGAGYANLDLFRRATDASREPLVALVGEASFHQYHEGTTTNVDMAMKGTRVRAYENRYVQLRGRPYGGIDPVDIRVRGQVRTLQAVMSRQRPMSPARIGVTDRVRPGTLPVHFDENAQDYLQSAYVECGLHDRALWAGQRIGMAPTDALTIQEIVFRIKPSRIVTVNAAQGFLLFLSAALEASGLPGTLIVAVSSQAPAIAVPGCVRVVTGAASDPATLAEVTRRTATDGPVMVLFAPDDGDLLPIEALMQYAGLVTCRSYLVFLGTALGQPWLGYSTRWHMTAIRMLLARAPFTIDTYCNPHLLTTSPLGYLLRTEPEAANGPAI
jgi:cephalosporin hydroxylase